MIVRTLLTTAALCGLCATAQAAPETHDGFFLQFNIGPSGQSWLLEDPAPVIDELTVTGRGAQFDFSIGGAVTENIVLFGVLSANTVLGPTLTLRGGNIAAGDTSGDDVSASTVGFGGGVAYYFMPAHVYVSAAVLSVQMQIAEDAQDRNNDDDREERASELGTGVQIRVGKEWWVSEEWSLGVAASYLRASIPEKDLSNDWAVNNFALTFTATYN